MLKDVQTTERLEIKFSTLHGMKHLSNENLITTAENPIKWHLIKIHYAKKGKNSYREF